MQSKHFLFKTRGEGRYALKWEESYEKEFNDFLRSIYIGDIISIAFSSELDECVVVFIAQNEILSEPVIPVEPQMEETPPQESQQAEFPNSGYDGPVETPLGEQIDSGTEEADLNNPEPELF